MKIFNRIISFLAAFVAVAGVIFSAYADNPTDVQSDSETTSVVGMYEN